MRRLVYVVLFAGVVLGIVNLTLSNSLATEGEFLRSVSLQKTLKSQEISKLHQAVMEAQGLRRVETRAREIGLTDAVKHTHLKTELLAHIGQ